MADNEDEDPTDGDAEAPAAGEEQPPAASTTPASGEQVATSRHTEVGDLTYEQARDELVGIVAQIESGQAGLEESMRLWERGEALAAHCSTWLDQAQTRLDERQRTED